MIFDNALNVLPFVFTKRDRVAVYRYAESRRTILTNKTTESSSICRMHFDDCRGRNFSTRFNVGRKRIELTYQVVKQTVNQLSEIKLNCANNSRCRVVLHKWFRYGSRQPPR